MAETSAIEWTDATFNPWVGCTKVSPACDHCYAESWAKRSGQVEWGGARRRTSPANWRVPVKLDKLAASEGRRLRVFCASLADVFDNQVPGEWRDDLWALIRATPNLDWQLLTKRPQNIVKMLPADWGKGYPNVWLGTTVENQEEADRRIPHLLGIPAVVRFLSCEPLLGMLDLTAIADGNSGRRFNCLTGTYCHVDLNETEPLPWLRTISWVIAGGESGSEARPSHPDWLRELRDQCGEAGVPFLFKQWGEFAPGEVAADYLNPEKPAKGLSWFDGRWDECWSEIDGHCDDEPDVYRVGKKRAARTLDGIQHDGFPL